MGAILCVIIENMKLFLKAVAIIMAFGRIFAKTVIMAVVVCQMLIFYVVFMSNKTNE